jgi:FtsH-binding integral membrane protein
VLASLVCVLLVRGVLHVPVFAPRGEGTWGNLTTSGLALAAAGAALAATLLMHLLLLAAPQPGTFFVWIITLATVAVILLAFTTSRQLSSQIGSAAVYAVVGLTVGCLVSVVGRSAARGPAAADYQA